MSPVNRRIPGLSPFWSGVFNGGLWACLLAYPVAGLFLFANGHDGAALVCFTLYWVAARLQDRVRRLFDPQPQ